MRAIFRGNLFVMGILYAVCHFLRKALDIEFNSEKR